MAAAVATPQTPVTFRDITETSTQTSAVPRRHDVTTSINYWKDPGDGSLPMPIVIAK